MLAIQSSLVFAEHETDKRQPNSSRRTNHAALERNQQEERREVQQLIQRTKQDLEAARRALAKAGKDASAAEADLRHAMADVAAAVEAFAKSELDNEKAEQQLSDVEAQLIASQGSDTEFTRAKLALDAARKSLQAEQERVFNTPQYKQQYEEALNSPDKAALLSELRTTALENDSKFVAALDAWKETDLQFARIRRELFGQNSSWTTAAKAASQARVAQTMAQQHLKGRLIARNNQRDRLKDAENLAAAAKAAVARDEAVLKRLEAAEKRLANTQSNKNRKPGKPKSKRP